MDGLRTDFMVTVPPATEPVTLDEAHAYTRVDFTNDDTLIAGLISQCREAAEQAVGKGFAPQTIQVQYTMPIFNGNTLSGASLLYDQDFYQYNESLGANPYSPAPFILKIPLSPLQGVSLFEYRITAFDQWQTWPAEQDGVANYTLDTITIPGLVYLQYPPPAYQYRLTCTVGYTTLPQDLKQALIELVAWKYDNREGPAIPDGIVDKLLGRKTWTL